ncbi:MAG: hypothetical protein ACK5AM_18725, partial [Pirellulaceae bacterium]
QTKQTVQMKALRQSDPDGLLVVREIQMSPRRCIASIRIRGASGEGERKLRSGKGAVDPIACEELACGLAEAGGFGRFSNRLGSKTGRWSPERSIESLEKSRLHCFM